MLRSWRKEFIQAGQSQPNLAIAASLSSSVNSTEAIFRPASPVVTVDAGVEGDCCFLCESRMHTNLLTAWGLTIQV
ncbi:hypothetical protein [Scytonema sp. PCC 10023]|uniref:hypothetical protein n=1 Tax=Scytonema sp. PCC 10023 TaxID=1680591 RepID=UPI0039C5D100